MDEAAIRDHEGPYGSGQPPVPALQGDFTRAGRWTQRAYSGVNRLIEHSSAPRVFTVYDGRHDRPASAAGRAMPPGAGLSAVQPTPSLCPHGDCTVYRPRFALRLTLSAGVAPGVALAQLVTRMAAHTMSVEREAIEVAPDRSGSKGYPLEGNTYFYSDASAMLLLTRLIESCLAANRAECDVYAGFQRLSLFRPQDVRYLSLLDHLRHLFLYGLNDEYDQAVLQHPRLLRLPIAPQRRTLLEWFWFLVVDDPRLQTALVAQQVRGSLDPASRRDRMYAGFWTFDPALVRQLVQMLQGAGRALYHDAWA